MTETSRPVPFAPEYRLYTDGTMLSPRNLILKGSTPAIEYYSSPPGAIRNIRYSCHCLKVDGIARRISKAILLAVTFLDMPFSDKYVAKYKDGNIANNDLSNIFWMSYSESIQYNKTKAIKLHCTPIVGD